MDLKLPLLMNTYQIFCLSSLYIMDSC
jgi:hypothetical protein